MLSSVVLCRETVTHVTTSVHFYYHTSWIQLCAYTYNNNNMSYTLAPCHLPIDFGASLLLSYVMYHFASTSDDVMFEFMIVHTYYIIF